MIGGTLDIWFKLVDTKTGREGNIRVKTGVVFEGNQLKITGLSYPKYKNIVISKLRLEFPQYRVSMYK